MPSCAFRPWRPSRLWTTLGLLAWSAAALTAAPTSSEKAVARQERAELAKARERAAQFAAGAMVSAVGQGALTGVQPTLASAEVKLQVGKAAARPGAGKIDALMIGDSMTVGGFGDAMERYLVRIYGRRAAMFASCGSSPEHWLGGESTFHTKCGYRERSPEKGSILRDFVNGHPPAPYPTPKLEDLLERYRPSTLIVQLGTNWMDALEGRSFATERPKYATILARFAKAVETSKSVPRVIWISPPDSARYAPVVERNVDDLLRAVAKQNGFVFIDSSTMTHYVTGKTGGDGVHYRDEDASLWARKVQEVLLRKKK